MRRLAASVTAVAVVVAMAPAAVAAANHPPVAVDDPAIPGCQPFDAWGGATPMVEDITEQAPGFDPGWFVLFGACSPLANDTDADGDALTLELVGQPAHGEAVWYPEGFLAYRADPDFSTPPGDEPGGSWISDEIHYRLWDGTAYSNTASYRYWVAPINDPPTFTPGDDVVTAHLGDGAVSVPWATDISAGPANEIDQDVSFEVTLLDITGVPNMFATPPSIDGDGVLHFTTGSEVGLATVTVQARDDGGLETYGMPSGSMVAPDDTSDEVTFAIVIGEPPPNRDPSAVDDAASVPEGTGGVIDVLGNDSDLDDDALSVTSAGGASHGTTTIVADGIRYVPGTGFVGTDLFIYTVSDGHGGTDEASVAVSVVKDGTAPTVTSATRQLLRQVVPGKVVDVKLAWAATDAGTGVASYQLQERIGEGSWRTVTLPTKLTTSATRAMTVGTTYRYRMRAADVRGNTSAWTTWAAITPKRVEQTSSSVRWGGTWSSVRDTRFSGGSARRTSSSGLKAVLTFSGRDVGWVTMRSTIGGRAQIRVDGTLVATVDVDGAKTGYRRMVWTRRLSSGGSHTLEIRPLGDGRVTVDAFIVLP
ncbi:MAG TPA: Ig-like domain-containing protein [Candidatus Limnocylindrales bacterium]|nr:Ig-like domain-containing protein [Candidatus Limnocylindrales bacterium]